MADVPGPSFGAATACDDLSDPDRLRALAESGLDSEPDRHMERFAERVRHWLRVPVALVSLVRPDEQVFPGAAGLGEPWATARRTPLTHSFCQHVVRTGRALVIEDAREDPRVAGNLAIPELGVAAYAGMPLTDDAGRVLGSLCAIDTVPRWWTSTELDALGDLADACSGELRLRLARVDADRERARRDRLELSLRESFERSQTLWGIARSVGAATSMEDVGAALTDLAGEVLGADYVAMLTVEGETLRLLAAPEITPTVSRPVWSGVTLDENAPAARAVRERRIVTCPNRDEFDRGFSREARARLDALGLHAVVAAPVLGRHGAGGVLVLGWRRPREFSSPDLMLVSTASAYLARATDRVGWVQHRVRVAHQMQQALVSELPDVPGLALAARYRPADAREHVGGDWYDVCPLPDPDRPRDAVVALSVGDIVGHELPAAITMGQVRSMLRQAAWDRAAGPPSAAMHAFESANNGLGVRAVGTAVLAYLRRQESGVWSMTWVNAGHPLPVLVRPDGSTELLEGHQRWFGLPHGAVEQRRDREISLPPGSLLVLYTDGLVERQGHDTDGRVETLRDVLAAHSRADPESVVGAVMAEVGGGGADDIVVVAARVT